MREKLSNLSEFVLEIKAGFARYYNRRHNRRGYFWGDRFESVIVEKGETLINCLAYIDLNPLRASMVERPEKYRWNSIGYHIQTGNKDNFLSLDFGPVKCALLSLRELHGASLQEFGILDAKERLRGYRRYVYEAGALDHSEIGKRKIIEEAVVEKEQKKNLKSAESTAFDTEHVILRIQESSEQRSLFPSITSGLMIFLCRNEKRFPRRLPVWMAFIH